MEGMVFNIQRFSVHDGPGIRTTVFLKGCSLHCFWCHNPESIQPDTEIQFFSHKCTGCGKCFRVCPVHAHQVINGERVFLRNLCLKCGMCTKSCLSEALVLTGKLMTVDEVMDEVEQDKLFYEDSGGGVTFSGGEPLLQIEFIKALLIESKKRELHTVVETAGNVPKENFAEVLPYVDLFLYDIKAADDEKHRQATGAGNTRILGNLKDLCENGADILVRVPVIPGVNDNEEEMNKIAVLVKELNRINYVELLPFHNLGGSKYKSLNMDYKAKDFNSPTRELMSVLADVFKDKGLDAKVVF